MARVFRMEINPAYPAHPCAFVVFDFAKGVSENRRISFIRPSSGKTFS
jgi:hypothetical protein